MRPTTMAKIGAGDRLLRFNNAVGIADMFEVSVDFLLGRNATANRSELTYRLRVFLDAAEQSHQHLRRRFGRCSRVEPLRLTSEPIPHHTRDMFSRLVPIGHAGCVPRSNSVPTTRYSQLMAHLLTVTSRRVEEHGP